MLVSNYYNVKTAFNLEGLMGLEREAIVVAFLTVALGYFLYFIIFQGFCKVVNLFYDCEMLGL